MCCKPCVVSAFIFGKLIASGKNRKLWLHHATAVLPVLGWHVGREMRLWAFMLLFVRMLNAAHNLGFPFQQGYAGSSEEIDRDNQRKGMIEKINSGRVDLVDEYDRELENRVCWRGWVEKDGFMASSSTEGSVLQMELLGTSFTASRMRSKALWNSLQEGDIDAKSSCGETG